MTAEKKYPEALEALAKDFEERCVRCGKCCGSEDGDPCAELVKNPDGTFSCRVYPDRLGPRRTVSGGIFTCVGIKELVRMGALRIGCAYKDL